MKVKIKNIQKIKLIDEKKLKKFIKKVLFLLEIRSKEIHFVFSDNRFIQELNRRFLKKDYPTDVLSFYLEDEFADDLLGEVIISVEQALINSDIYGKEWQEELKLYIIHGILHLLGFNDTTKHKKKLMRVKEREIMEKLNDC